MSHVMECQFGSSHWSLMSAEGYLLALRGSAAMTALAKGTLSLARHETWGRLGSAKHQWLLASILLALLKRAHWAQRGWFYLSFQLLSSSFSLLEI